MPADRKKDTEKIPTLKGKEAEDRILKYMKEANRPYGAADVSANIKNVVSKPATQKILAALAERGDITQKMYGKTCYYVANQSDCEAVSSEQAGALEIQIKQLEEEEKSLTAQHKALNAELRDVRGTPKNGDLEALAAELEEKIEELENVLRPLRTGAPPISEAEILQLDIEWTKWRGEWASRKKIFQTAWATATESLGPTESAELAEQLGIELDTAEHLALEKSPLYQAKPKRR